MTPAQHAIEAERLLLEAADYSPTVSAGDRLSAALSAVGHGLLAVAYELGVPVPTDAQVGGGDGV